MKRLPDGNVYRMRREIISNTKKRRNLEAMIQDDILIEEYINRIV